MKVYDGHSTVNADNFAPYQGTAMITMNSDKTLTTTFEDLNKFRINNSGVLDYYFGLLVEVVLPAVDARGNPVIEVTGNLNDVINLGSIFPNPASIITLTIPDNVTKLGHMLVI